MASKDNTPSRQLPFTSPESLLQKTTLLLQIIYHLTRITASKYNTLITTPSPLFLFTITNIKPSYPLFYFNYKLKAYENGKVLLLLIE